MIMASHIQGWDHIESPGPNRAAVYLSVRDLGLFARQEYEQAYCLLSEAEQHRVGCLESEDDRRRFVLGADMVRSMLAEALDCAPIHIDIADFDHKKSKIEDMYYSVGHSGSYVACAISDRPVGIDIEHNEQANLQLALLALKKSYAKCLGLPFQAADQMDFSFDAEGNVVTHEKELSCKVYFPFCDCALAACTIQTLK